MTSIASRQGLARVLMACVMATSAASPVSAQSIGFTASMNGVRGTYPGERIDSVYVFNALDMTAGPVHVSATVPWMRMQTTLPDTAGEVTVTAPPATSGLGDPLLRVDLSLIDSHARGLQAGVATSVKLPVVDAASGRGTGETDAALGAAVFKSISRTSIMADVLFWKYGDPDGVDFTDAWSYSLSAARMLGDGRWSAIVSIAGFTAGVNDMPAPVALNVGAMRLVGGGQSLGVAASVGLNDGASDFSIGMTWRIARQQPLTPTRQ